eukprot:SM000008S22371  [mRNA]  locus=s8:1335161:1346140:+ [translate_table: standard]
MTKGKEDLRAAGKKRLEAFRKKKAGSSGRAGGQDGAAPPKAAAAAAAEEEPVPGAPGASAAPPEEEPGPAAEPQEVAAGNGLQSVALDVADLSVPPLSDSPVSGEAAVTADEETAATSRSPDEWLQAAPTEEAAEQQVLGAQAGAGAPALDGTAADEAANEAHQQVASCEEPAAASASSNGSAAEGVSLDAPEQQPEMLQQSGAGEGEVLVSIGDQAVLLSPPLSDTQQAAAADEGRLNPPPTDGPWHPPDEQHLDGSVDDLQPESKSKPADAGVDVQLRPSALELDFEVAKSPMLVPNGGGFKSEPETSVLTEVAGSPVDGLLLPKEHGPPAYVATAMRSSSTAWDVDGGGDEDDADDFFSPIGTPRGASPPPYRTASTGSSFSLRLARAIGFAGKSPEEESVAQLRMAWEVERKETQAAMGELKRQMEAATQRWSEMEAEKARLRAELAAKAEALEEREQAGRQLQDEADAMRQQYQAVVGSLQSMGSGGQGDAVAHSTGTLGRLEIELLDLRRALVAKDQALVAVKKEADQGRQRMRVELDPLAEEVARLQAYVAGKEGEADALVRRNAELVAVVAARDTEVEMLNAEAVALEARSAAAREKLAMALRKGRDLVESRAALKRALAERTDEAAALAASNERLAAEAKAHEEGLVAALQQVADLRVRADALQEGEVEQAGIREKLGMALRKGKEVVAQREALKEALAERAAEVEHLAVARDEALKATASLQATLDSQLAEVAALREVTQAESLAKEQALAQMEHVCKELVVVRGELDVALQAKLDAATAAEASGAECFALRASLSSKEAELAEVREGLAQTVLASEHAHKELTELRAASNALTQASSSDVEAKEAAMMEVEGLREALSDMAAEFARLKEAASTGQAEAGDTAKQALAEAEGLRLEVASLQERCESIAQSEQSVIDRADAASTEAESLRTSLSTRERELTELQEEATRTAAGAAEANAKGLTEMESLRAALADAAAEAARLAGSLRAEAEAKDWVAAEADGLHVVLSKGTADDELAEAAVVANGLRDGEMAEVEAKGNALVEAERLRQALSDLAAELSALRQARVKEGERLKAEVAAKDAALAQAGELAEALERRSSEVASLTQAAQAARSAQELAIAEAETCRASLMELTAERDALGEAKAQAGKAEERALADCSRLAKDLDSRLEELRQAEASVGVLAQTLAARESALEALAAELGSQGDAMQAAQAELDAHHRLVQELREQLADRDQHVEVLKEQLARDMAAAEASLVQEREEREELAAAAVELQSRCTELEAILRAEREQQGKEASTSGNMLQCANRRVEELTLQLADVQGESDQLSRLLALRDDDLTSLKAQLESQDKATHAAQMELERLSGCLDELQQSLHNKDEEFVALEEQLSMEVAAKEASLKQEQEERLRLADLVAELQSQCTALEGSLLLEREQQSKEASTTAEMLQQANSQVEDLTKQLGVSQREAQELRQHLALRTDELKDLTAQLGGQGEATHAAQLELRSLHTRVRELQESLHNREEEFSALEEQLSQDVAAKEASLKHEQTESRRLAGEVSELQSKCTELEGLLRSVQEEQGKEASASSRLLQSSKERVEYLTAQLGDVQDKHALLQQGSEELGRLLALRDQELKALLGGQGDAASAAQAELEMSVAHVHELQESLRNKDKEFVALEEQLSQDMAAKEASLRQEQEESQRLATMAAELQSRCAELEALVNTIQERLAKETLASTEKLQAAEAHGKELAVQLRNAQATSTSLHQEAEELKRLETSRDNKLEALRETQSRAVKERDESIALLKSKLSVAIDGAKSAADELENLKASHKHVELLNASLRQSLEEAKEDAAAPREGANSDCESKLAEAGVEILKVQEQAAVLREKLQKAVKKGKGIEAAKAKLEKDLAERDAVLQASEREKLALSKKLEELSVVVSGQDDALVAALHEKAAAEEARLELAKALEDKRAEEEQLLESLGQREKKCTESKAAVEQAQAEAAAKEAALWAQVRSLQSELERTELACADDKARTGSALGQLAKAKEMLADSVREAESDRQRVAELSAEHAAMRAQLESLGEQLAEAEESSRAEKAAAAVLGGKAEQLQAAALELQALIEAKDSEVRQLHTDASQHETSMVRIATERDALAEQVEVVEAQLKETTLSLEDLSTKAQAWRSELQQAKQLCIREEGLRLAAEEQVATLQATLQAAQATVNVHVPELEQQKAALESTQKELAELRAASSTEASANEAQKTLEIQKLQQELEAATAAFEQQRVASVSAAVTEVTERFVKETELALEGLRQDAAAELAAVVAEKEQELVALRSREEQQLHELQLLQDQVGALSRDSEEAAAELGRSRTDAELLAARVKSLEQAGQERDNARLRIEVLAARAAVLEEELAVRDAEAKELAEAAESGRVEHQRRRALEEEMAALKEVMLSKDADLRDRSAALAEVERARDELHASMSSLRAALQEKDQSVVQATSQRVRAIEMLDAANSEVEAMQRQSEEAVAVAESLQEENTAFQARVQALELELRSLPASNMAREAVPAKESDMVGKAVEREGEASRSWQELHTAGGEAREAVGGADERQHQVHDLLAEVERWRSTAQSQEEESEELRKEMEGVLREAESWRALTEERQLEVAEVRQKLQVALEQAQMLKETVDGNSAALLQGAVERKSEATSREMEDMILPCIPGQQRRKDSRRAPAPAIPSPPILRKSPSLLSYDIEAAQASQRSEDDEDEVRGFKLVHLKSQHLPGFLRPSVNGIDKLCLSAGRYLMGHPAARLALTFYWLALHALLAAMLSTVRV